MYLNIYLLFYKKFLCGGYSGLALSQHPFQLLSGESSISLLPWRRVLDASWRFWPSEAVMQDWEGKRQRAGQRLSAYYSAFLPESTIWETLGFVTLRDSTSSHLLCWWQDTAVATGVPGRLLWFPAKAVWFRSQQFHWQFHSWFWSSWLPHRQKRLWQASSVVLFSSALL
jgi:hypothetical protein